MDFLEIIITIAVLGVIGLLPGGKKGKKTATQQSAKPRSAGNPRPFHPVFETIEDAVDDDVWNENHSEESNREESYFTYENLDENEEYKFQSVSTEPIRVSEKTKMRPCVMGEEFDLRKAFIYQTILERVEC